MLKDWFRRALGRSTKDDDIERKLGRYLADSNACMLLRLVMENPGIQATSLAIRAHMDEDTVAACLENLAGDGLVVTEKENGQACFHIAGAAKAAVVERLPLNYQCPGMMRE
jgi:hypothetical protein